MNSNSIYAPNSLPVTKHLYGQRAGLLQDSCQGAVVSSESYKIMCIKRLTSVYNSPRPSECNDSPQPAGTVVSNRNKRRLTVTVTATRDYIRDEISASSM
jgi:hypothetical protein